MGYSEARPAQGESVDNWVKLYMLKTDTREASLTKLQNGHGVGVP